mmetsp:Transcript_49624/g.97798  ORF Transcript_49624/g.97798 Transcript_49624/m.97798 type:complete len:107 (+) Transcript_49624:436-756(+)
MPIPLDSFSLPPLWCTPLLNPQLSHCQKKKRTPISQTGDRQPPGLRILIRFPEESLLPPPPFAQSDAGDTERGQVSVGIENECSKRKKRATWVVMLHRKASGFLHS